MGWCHPSLVLLVPLLVATFSQEAELERPQSTRDISQTPEKPSVGEQKDPIERPGKIFPELPVNLGRNFSGRPCLQQLLISAMPPLRESDSLRTGPLRTEKGGWYSLKSEWKRLGQTLVYVYHSTVAMALMSHSAITASVAMAVATVQEEVKSGELEHKTTKATRRRMNVREKQYSLGDWEDVEGARLLSSSFQVISYAFGVVADGVRITGDTVAGFLGSATKLTGTIVKSASNGFHSASQLLDPGATASFKRDLTFKRIFRISVDHDDESSSHVSLIRQTRQIAAKIARLLASVFNGVGESLVLAGDAAESITSNTICVAEDVVRLGEGIAGTISSSLGRHVTMANDLRRKAKIKSHYKQGDQRDSKGDSFLQFGVRSDFYCSNEEDGTETCGAHAEVPPSNAVEETYSLIRAWYELTKGSMTQLKSFLFLETQGVPSMASELLVVMLLCFLAAILLLGPSSEKGQTTEVKVSRIRNCFVRMFMRLTIPLSAAETELASMPTLDQLQPNFGKTCVDTNFNGLRFLVAKVVRGLNRVFRRTMMLLGWLTLVGHWVAGLVLNRKTALLAIYTFGWVFLCRSAQLRGFFIRRAAEADGFRSAIASLGSPYTSYAESAMWLNAVLKQAWRVPLSIHENMEQTAYPPFVQRAIRSIAGKHESCRGAGALNARSIPPHCSLYGGLEPYLSAKIGEILMSGLESASESKPRDVAYVSLFSLTLGSHPPLARSVQLRGLEETKNGATQLLRLDLDLDLLLEDMSLVLEVKLSSLKYSLIPSTKIAVHSLDLQLPLKMSLGFSADYPFVETLELSLHENPSCSVGITPLSKDSGLQGVDLGSLPLIRKWVQDAIRQQLSAYVTPKYVEIDLGVLLSSSSSDYTLIRPDIGQLRQKTTESRVRTRRTSIPEGTAITSISEALASFHYVTGSLERPEKVAVEQEQGPAGLLRPTTKLSQMAMDRLAANLTFDMRNRTH